MPFFHFQKQRLFFREQGNKNPDLPLALLLHGDTASSAAHVEELKFISGLGYHTAALDFPGCGQSDRIAAPWPLDQWRANAGAAAALLDHLGYAQCIVVGCSGGAITALWMALDYPQRLRAVIADSATPTFPAGHLAQEVHNRIARTPAQIDFWSSMQGQDWEAVVDADSDFLSRLDQANPHGIDVFGSRLAEIRCPTLFTVSLTDRLLHDPGQQNVQAAQQIPDSWLVAVHGGDHPLMWSRAKEWQAAARAFLESLEI